MGPRLRQLLHLLIEPVPEPGAVAARQRLSRPGQALVASGVILLGLVVYGLSWGVTSTRARRFDFCTASSRISAGVVREVSEAQAPRGASPGAQAWTDPLSLALLADLKAASRGQRLLLEEQIATLTLWILRQCALVRNDHIQLVSLSTLATAATALLVIAALVRLPKGLQEISRLEQAIVLPAMALLVASMSSVQLGQQQSHARANWTYYQRSLRLMALVRSSLANQQLLLPASPNADAPASPAAPLDDPQAIASLVNRLDSWLESVERGAVRVDNAFAQSMFTNLEQRAREPDQPGAAEGASEGGPGAPGEAAGGAASGR